MNHHYRLRPRQPSAAQMPTHQDEPQFNDNIKRNSNRGGDDDDDDDDYRPTRYERYITSQISRLSVTPEAGSQLHTTAMAPVDSSSTQVEWATVNTRPQAGFVVPLSSGYSKQSVVDRMKRGRSAPLDNRKHGPPGEIRPEGAKRMRETQQVNTFLTLLLLL